MEQDNKENNQNKQNEFKTVTFNTDKSFKNVTKEKKIVQVLEKLWLYLFYVEYLVQEL